MSESIEARLAALERAVTDGDVDLTALASDAELADRVEQAEARLDDLERQVTDLEAATQALRGYVGNVRSVNRDVEQRADAALAAVDRLAEDSAASESEVPTNTFMDEPAEGTDPRGTDLTRDNPPNGGPNCRDERLPRSRAGPTAAETEPAAPRPGDGPSENTQAATGRAGPGPVDHGRNRTDGGRQTGDDPKAAARPRWQDPPAEEGGPTDAGLLARIRALL